MDHSRVRARLRHGRELAVVGSGEFLAKLAVLVGHIPIPGLAQQQTLCGLEAERLDVAAEDEQACQLLTAGGHAELGGLLDRADGVAPGVGQAHYLCLRGLGLKQVGGEIVARERMPDLAENLATVLDDDSFGIAFERVAEGVVGSHEEPTLATRLDNRLARPIRQCPSVVGPVDGIGRAGLAGEVGGAAAGDNHHLVLLLGHLVDRQDDRRGRHVDDSVHLVHVEPAAGDARPDVRLVLVVGGHNLHLQTMLLGREVLDRLLRGPDRTGTSQPGINAGLIVEHADPDHAVRDLGLRRRGRQQRGERKQLDAIVHPVSPLLWGYIWGVPFSARFHAFPSARRACTPAPVGVSS
ncbi:hypothetical protein D9M70_411720 [compost metagenome]